MGNLYRSGAGRTRRGGANIITRNLIVFGQGAISRAKIPISGERTALGEADSAQGLDAFDRRSGRHIGSQRRAVRAWGRSWTGGFASGTRCRSGDPCLSSDIAIIVGVRAVRRPWRCDAGRSDKAQGNASAPVRRYPSKY